MSGFFSRLRVAPTAVPETLPGGPVEPSEVLVWHGALSVTEFRAWHRREDAAHCCPWHQLQAARRVGQASAEMAGGRCNSGSALCAEALIEFEQNHCWYDEICAVPQPCKMLYQTCIVLCGKTMSFCCHALYTSNIPANIHSESEALVENIISIQTNPCNNVLHQGFPQSTLFNLCGWKLIHNNPFKVLSMESHTWSVFPGRWTTSLIVYLMERHVMSTAG